MMTKHKLTYYIAATILLPVVAGAVGLTILQSRGGQLVSIQDSSMQPGLKAGDALIAESVRAADIEVGNVIIFDDPNKEGQLLVRRVTSIDHKRGMINSQSDTSQRLTKSMSFDSVNGRAVAVGHKLGTVYDFVHKPIGIFLAVYLPVLMIIVAEVFRVVAYTSISNHLLDYTYEPKRSKI